jgi:hypothetical protein
MKPSSNYRSFMNNNTAIGKQQKNSPNINSLLTKPNPIKKQLPKKCVTTRIQGNSNNTNKPRSSIQDPKMSNRLNISKAMEKLTTFNENTIHNLEKNLSHQIREQACSVLSATYRKTPTKYIENPLLSKIVKNNSTKIDLTSLNREKTLENNNVSYTKLAMKKSENTFKNDDSRIQEIYKRFGKQTNFSKYKHLTKPKNSSMIIDNHMFDSETNSVILNTNNSLLFNRNKSELAEDIRTKQSLLKNYGNPLYKVIEEETNKTKLNSNKVYSERLKERDTQGLNFSVSSSVVNLNKEDEYSVRYTKSRNSESINKLKIATENKGNRFRDSNSYLEDSVNILNKESMRCNTTRAFEINCQMNNLNMYDINSTNEFNNYENRLPSGSENYDLNENKKTKVSTKEDTIKSNSNRFEIETIEEQHFMLVRFLHSTKKLLKLQEDNNKLKSIKLNLSNNQREVFPIEEIDLE